jgi:hypothetical protein
MSGNEYYTYIFMHSISKSEMFYGWKPANQSSFMEVNEPISCLIIGHQLI